MFSLLVMDLSKRLSLIKKKAELLVESNRGEDWPVGFIGSHSLLAGI